MCECCVCVHVCVCVCVCACCVVCVCTCTGVCACVVVVLILPYGLPKNTPLANKGTKCPLDHNSGAALEEVKCVFTARICQLRFAVRSDDMFSFSISCIGNQKITSGEGSLLHHFVQMGAPPSDRVVDTSWRGDGNVCKALLRITGSLDVEAVESFAAEVMGRVRNVSLARAQNFWKPPISCTNAALQITATSPLKSIRDRLAFLFSCRE